MNTYMIFEIGKSAYTEFKMKNGKFAETQDAILVDEIEAISEEEAYKQLYDSPNHKDKVFHNLMIRRIHKRTCSKTCCD